MASLRLAAVLLLAATAASHRPAGSSRAGSVLCRGGGDTLGDGSSTTFGSVVTWGIGDALTAHPLPGL
jgi:hypothetical protein